MVRMRRVGVWLAVTAAFIGVGWAGLSALRRRPLDDALRTAARADDGRLVRLLLHRGADPQTQDSSHVPLVDWALGENKPDIAQALLEAGAKTDASFMLLHAAENDDAAVIQILLDRNADPNVTDKEGRSPLHLTAGHGGGASVKALLQHHANPNARDRNGATPLMFAAAWPNFSNAAVESETALLESGADVNAQAADGNTALIEALKIGKDEATFLLLRHGADPNLCRKDGTSPLILAVQASRFNSNVVRALLRAGADPKHTDGQGHTAAEIARQCHHDGVVPLLH